MSNLNIINFDYFSSLSLYLPFIYIDFKLSMGILFTIVSGIIFGCFKNEMIEFYFTRFVSMEYLIVFGITQCIRL